MYVLGIETSCDETAASVVSSKKEVLSNIIFSQVDLHKIYGGIVPEIAARNHTSVIDKVISFAMSESRLNFHELDGICATAGPGLSGGLIIGLIAGKTLSLVLNKPFYAVNHLEGHALTVQLTNNISPPYLLLLISGGHTQLIVILDIGKYKLLGTTLDDALGECFDKVAKMLNLPLFNGKVVEQYAKDGNKHAFILPETMLSHKNCNFSFAGIKSAINKLIKQLPPLLTEQQKCDICASFQHTIIKILTRRIKYALKLINNDIKYFVIAGGVAANQEIKKSLTNVVIEYGLELVSPPIEYCTDNAAMIAWAGLQHLIRKEYTNLDCGIRARWDLQNND